MSGQRGWTFGRFNDVDVAYGVKIGRERRDIAVVTDRGCDRLRIYSIDPDRPHGSPDRHHREGRAAALSMARSATIAAAADGAFRGRSGESDR